MSEENKAFSISYSGEIKDELEQYKIKYAPRETTKKIKRLRVLDKRVDFISTMIAIAFGMFGSAIMIAGTVFLIKNVLAVFTSCMLIVPGTVILAVVPFLYSKIYSYIKNAYAPEILKLINEIEHNSL